MKKFITDKYIGVGSFLIICNAMGPDNDDDSQVALAIFKLLIFCLKIEFSNEINCYKKMRKLCNLVLQQLFTKKKILYLKRDAKT